MPEVPPKNVAIAASALLAAFASQSVPAVVAVARHGSQPEDTGFAAKGFSFPADPALSVSSTAIAPLLSSEGGSVRSSTRMEVKHGQCR